MSQTNNFDINTQQPYKNTLQQQQHYQYLPHQSLDDDMHYGDQELYMMNNTRQQIGDGENESSGIGALPDTHAGLNDGSLDMRMMIRGSINSSNDMEASGAGQLKHNNILVNKSSEDLTLDMLGDPTTNTQYPQNSYLGTAHQQDQPYGFVPQITSKNPPSSALNLHANFDQSDSRGHLHKNELNLNQYGASEPTLSLEQYRQNNANLQQILMQFDSTPQFNQVVPTTNKHADSAPHSMKVPSGGHIQSRAALGQFAPSSGDTLNEVSQFTYMQQPQFQQPQYRAQNNPVYIKPEAVDQIEKIRDNLSKIELLQQAIHSQQNSQPSSNQSNNRRGGALGLQAAGIQILQNENKNQVNNSYAPTMTSQIQLQQLPKTDKTKLQPVKNQQELVNKHKDIMSNFDDIPIVKIKTMVGYQTNIDMYRSDAKLPPSTEEEISTIVQAPPQYVPKESVTTNNEGSDDSEGEEGLSLEERLYARQWKVRMRASKEINQLFYNDYAKSQSDSSHPMLSFDQFGPLLQEMIKDTNLTNAYEALQCLYSYVRFANDIRQVTFSCHIYLLEKVQTNKSNFREITLKIILCMLRRLQGPSNTILPELLKRFKSKNSKCATFCLQVILEAFKTKEQAIIQDMNLRSLFKAIQAGLTHQNKEIRDAAYSILKFICERCKDEPSAIVQNCSNLRPVQIKELSEELSKVQKVPNANLMLFDENHGAPEDSNGNDRDLKIQKQKTVQDANPETKVDSVQNNEQETFDLLTLVPDDFLEIPYTQAINTKKRSMESFNTELQKIVDKGQNAIVKQKDYSMLLNIVFHMLEDKNMLVFMEAIKSVELLSILQQLKSAKVKPFITLLAGKYGETKTAVIAATDKAMAAIVRHSLTPVVFADIVINQIATTHKNPRVKQFLLTNPLSHMLQTCDHSIVAGVFKSINKSITSLILKDNNDAVRNAAVQSVIEFGLLMQSEESFTVQIQTLIQQLPKSRISEINKKLNPTPVPPSEGQEFAKTMAPTKKSTLMTETAQNEDEFSKTLVPALQVTQQPSQFYQTLMRLIKQLPQNTASSGQLKNDLSEAMQNQETVKLLVKNRPLITKVLCDVISTNAKVLQKHQECVIVLIDLLKDLFMNEISQSVTIQLQDLQDFIQIGLLLTEIGIGYEAGLSSQILVLALESTDDKLGFFEILRTVVELPTIMQASQAIKIISNVYVWLGLKLNDFTRMGLSHSDIEELRSLGIKYLESTHLYNEKQRQQLIAVMIRFKDQIQEMRADTLQTLGQSVLPSSRSQQSSILDTKQQTAQFNREITLPTQISSQRPITAELICITIDKEFEQGLLMFKELAQSNQGLDFETKEKIFNKLLGIVSEGLSGSQQQHNVQQQQYRQAYALKALMWMKEETMGLEDTFKLTAPILAVYLMQINREIDASVEMYLLNFWVRELSIRDLADRIQTTVQQIRSSRNSSRSTHLQTRMSTEEQLDGFRILFTWLCEHKLDPSPNEWKMGDLRKIALLICESVLCNKSNSKDVCCSFIKQCVQRDGQQSVLEFMEIQLMHSNEVFLQFLDWFQIQYPNKALQQKPNIIPSVDVSKAQSTLSNSQMMANEAQQQLTERSDVHNISQQHLSYIERRQQKKTSNLKQAKKEIEQSEKQVREIISKIESEVDSSQQIQPAISETKPNLMTSSKGMEPRRSRYDESQQYHDKQYFDSIDNDELDQEILPIEEIKQVQAPERATSAAIKRQNEDRSLQEKVQQSEAKQRDWVQKIIELEAEKRRIEEETSMLKMQSNQESKVWQQKLSEMQNEHQQVICNLSEVNQCYLQQVDENEKLKLQLSNMQRQHEDMISRFEQIERKINSREEPDRGQTLEIPPQTPPRSENRQPRDHLMNSVAKLQRISDTFCVSDQQIGVHKICELLLSVERNVDGELAKPLIAHYCRMRTVDERLSMITAIGEALNINEDVLMALSIDVYKALLNFLLRAFAHEKERLDTQSLGRGEQRQEQNQVTMESQKLVSRLLNSKDFTASLVSLFQLLREAMPADLTPELPVEEGQYLRVLMRCISRITKALHSESSELIRGFDVLLEMQKIFLICPPENLREDLPSLADFDFVFRGMKDVSDKFIDLQPEKVQSFLGYCETRGPENAFIKYLRMKSLNR